MENAHYVYIWVHKDHGAEIKIETDLVSFELDKLPIYVGRGYGDRKDQHKNNENQPYLSDLIQKGEAECIVVKDNLSWNESVYLESYLISLIGTIKSGNGPLYNKTGGVFLPTQVPIITKNNIELNTLGLILKSLDENRTIESSAKDLGISARSLYRYMNSYKIKREKNNHRNQDFLITESVTSTIDNSPSPKWKRDDERGGWGLSFILPGIKKEDVDVTSGPGWARVKHPNASLRISLPKDSDHEAIEAKLDLGIFELFAPDVKASGIRTIKVQ